MHGEVREELKGTKQLAAEGDLSVEKQQEQELMNKLASNGRLPPKPQSNFLQKRLQHQRKFFDSGDYAMDRMKRPNSNVATDTVPSILTPVSSASASQGAPTESPLNVEVTMGEEALPIPRPDNVPQRKASIIYPSVHSKLSPQPHVHHLSYDDVHEP